MVLGKAPETSNKHGNGQRGEGGLAWEVSPAPSLPPGVRWSPWEVTAHRGRGSIPSAGSCGCSAWLGVYFHQLEVACGSHLSLTRAHEHTHTHTL